MKNNPIWTVLLCGLLAACGGPEGSFFAVEQGAFHTSFTETGELQAARYSIVTMPHFRWESGQPKIEQLEKEGLWVKKGDTVGKIETLGVAKALGQKKVDLQIAQRELDKLKAQQSNEINGLDAELRRGQGALRLAAMDTQRVAFESRSKKELKRLEYRKAELALRKIEGKIEYKRRTQVEDLLIKEAKITQIFAAIEKAKRAIERFTLRAPAEGMIEYRKYRRGRKVAIGDQLWRGQPIIGLPDLNQMKILTTVGETDIDKIRVGLRASVRLDAFPKVAFDGSITSISRISRRKERESKIKVFDVEVLLDTTDPILRPGMTVSCEFLVAALDDVLWVHPACVHKEDQGYVVYVKKNARLKNRRSKAGGPQNGRRCGARRLAGRRPGAGRPQARVILWTGGKVSASAWMVSRSTNCARG